jgi:hypothetical protein
MSSGADALYVDAQAGGGAPTHRSIGSFHCLTVPARFSSAAAASHFPTIIRSRPLYPAWSSQVVSSAGRFRHQCHNQRWGCHVLDIPEEACTASLHVDPPSAGNVRGPLSALVRYSS